MVFLVKNLIILLKEIPRIKNANNCEQAIQISLKNLNITYRMHTYAGYFSIKEYKRKHLLISLLIRSI